MWPCRTAQAPGSQRCQRCPAALPARLRRQRRCLRRPHRRQRPQVQHALPACHHQGGRACWRACACICGKRECAEEQELAEERICTGLCTWLLLSTFPPVVKRVGGLHWMDGGALPLSVFCGRRGRGLRAETAFRAKALHLIRGCRSSGESFRSRHKEMQLQKKQQQ